MAVEALVENHSRGSKSKEAGKAIDMSMDLIRGKGKGLIILLHGEPGVGKTSTAECIADFTKRPLYPMTCGDIGTSAAEVEQNLEKTFQHAHKWGCVLLLDEADVFLEERGRDDLKRNGVVSVFLRVLEYYSGILFLTTNRVGTLDQAFRSRIHLSLYYPQLTRKATVKLWNMHLRTAEEQFAARGREILMDKKSILKFAKQQFDHTTVGRWNGRYVLLAYQPHPVD
jgi:SpoVK/Ycf46/Vps4 family AAA+-type ATPase